MEIHIKENTVAVAKQPNSMIADFGTISKNSTAQFTAVLHGKNIKELSAKADCGCTVPTPKKIDDDTYEVHIRYKNTHLTTAFSKKVRINFNEEEKPSSYTIQIKGNVTNQRL